MKKLIYLILIPLFLFVAGCSDDDEKNPLEGTKWKLEGYVTSESTEIKVLETSDCEKCYTLNFGKNYTWNTFGIYNSEGGVADIQKDRIALKTQVASIMDASRSIDENISTEAKYFDLLSKTVQFHASENELYLYSENKSSCLIYKNIK